MKSLQEYLTGTLINEAQVFPDDSVKESLENYLKTLRGMDLDTVFETIMPKPGVINKELEDMGWTTPEASDNRGTSKLYHGWKRYADARDSASGMRCGALRLYFNNERQDLLLFAKEQSADNNVNITVSVRTTRPHANVPDKWWIDSIDWTIKK